MSTTTPGSAASLDPSSVRRENAIAAQLGVQPVPLQQVRHQMYPGAAGRGTRRFPGGQPRIRSSRAACGFPWARIPGCAWPQFLLPAARPHIGLEIAGVVSLQFTLRESKRTQPSRSCRASPRPQRQQVADLEVTAFPAHKRQCFAQAEFSDTRGRLLLWTRPDKSAATNAGTALARSDGQGPGHSLR